MGYRTEFKGELKFKDEPTREQLAFIAEMCGEDCRKHPEWKALDDVTYMDIELLPDFSGIRWNGAEKTYSMDKVVEVMVMELRKRWPEFELTGRLFAQGEEADDRWELVIDEDGMPKRVKTPPTGTKVVCPACEHSFYLESK
jgi:hypothetical protein